MDYAKSKKEKTVLKNATGNWKRRCACAAMSATLVFAAACNTQGSNTTGGENPDPETPPGETVVDPTLPSNPSTPSTPQTPTESNQLPFYVDPAEASYGEFTKEKMWTPYWLGNVIYNETVMLTDDGNGITGKLQYNPVKILSVRDYTWKKEYSASDYSVNGNVISVGRNTSLPYLKSENFVGENLPSGYRLVDAVTNVETDVVKMGTTIYTEGSLIYGHQISVSYVYDPSDIVGETSVFNAPKTLAKLKAGEDITIAATGDSVMEGCSTSGHFNHEPNMPTYIELVREALEEEYGGKITLHNKAIGGQTSNLAASEDHIRTIVAKRPDILFVHFGINDCGAKHSKNIYGDNLAYFIAKVQESLPDCEIVLIKAFPVHTGTYDMDLFEKYWKKLDDFCDDFNNVTTLDMYTPGMEMLKVKKYMDVTGNGINHLNDFSARLYAMYILNSLIDFTA